MHTWAPPPLHCTPPRYLLGALHGRKEEHVPCVHMKRGQTGSSELHDSWNMNPHPYEGVGMTGSHDVHPLPPADVRHAQGKIDEVCVFTHTSWSATVTPR